MAHNITERDGVFSVREPMWHGLGTVLDAHPTRDEAQKLVHNWEPISEPLYRKVPVIHEDGSLETSFEEVEGWRGNCRSDNNGLLGVTTDTYELVSNAEMYDIAEAIEGEADGSVMYETGGSLKGGAKVWLLIRLRDHLEIPGDPNGAIIPYYALQNSHDGLGSFRGQATMTRIVCDNTAQMADFDSRNRGTQLVFRHTSSINERIDEAKMALSGWRDSLVDYQDMAQALLATGITSDQRREFIERFIPMPSENISSQFVRRNVEKAHQQFGAILQSPTTVGIEHTAYGLLSAGVEYLNHERKAHSQESRFKRSYLDRDKLTSHLTKLVREVAHV